MEIGVLALQGDFAKHGEMLNQLGVKWREVRTPQDLKDLDGLILPGGESTTMLKLLREEGLLEPLRNFAQQHATFGTCAGAILLAKEVANPIQDSLGILDIAIERNAYGRQIDSFVDQVHTKKFGEQPLELVFIRAPRIKRLGDNVEVLVEHAGEPIMVRSGKILAATFHPELTKDVRIHQLFLDLVQAHSESASESAKANS